MEWKRPAAIRTISIADAQRLIEGSGGADASGLLLLNSHAATSARAAKEKEEKKEVRQQFATAFKFLMPSEEGFPGWSAPNETVLSEADLTRINTTNHGPYCTNVVAAASFNVKFDVQRMSWSVGGHNNAEAFSATFHQSLYAPRCTIMVFPMGTCNVAGAESPEMSILALQRYVTFLMREHGLCSAALRRFRVRNLHATAYLGYQVDLNLLADSMPAVRYHHRDPPAAKLTVQNPSATLLVFSTGSIVIVGTRSLAQATTVFRRAARILAYFKSSDLSGQQVRARKREAAVLRRKTQQAAARVTKIATVRQLLEARTNGNRKITTAHLPYVVNLSAITVGHECKPMRKPKRRKRARPAGSDSADLVRIQRDLDASESAFYAEADESLGQPKSCRHEVRVRYGKETPECWLGFLDASTIVRLFSQQGHDANLQKSVPAHFSAFVTQTHESPSSGAGAVAGAAASQS